MTNMIHNDAHCNKNFKKINYLTILITALILSILFTSVKAEENREDLESIETSDESSPETSEPSVNQNDKIELPNTEVGVSELKTYNMGKIIVLNKITATSKELTLKLGEPQYFGNIQIQLHKCVKNLDPYNEDNYILLSVTEHKIDEDPMLIFQGWLFSSSISVSGLMHPIYEIFAQNCF